MTRMSHSDVIAGPTSPADTPDMSRRPFPKYNDLDGHPGIVEIKPHSIAGIREGLEQLARYRADKDNWPDGKNPPKKIYLLTYTYRAALTRDNSDVTGFLLEPEKSVLDTALKFVVARKNRSDTNTAEKGRKPPLSKVLGVDWPALNKMAIGGRSGHSHTRYGSSRSGAGRVAGPSAIGSMLEYQLRTKFVEAYGVPKPKHLTGLDLKDASDWGADIEFLEIAEFLYELEAALGGRPEPGPRRLRCGSPGRGG